MADSPTVSGRLNRVENHTLRGIMEAIEKERVRQGLTLGVFMNAAWNAHLADPNVMYARTLCKALDELDMEVVLINKEGDQV